MSKNLVIELQEEMRILLTKYGLIKSENYDRPFQAIETMEPAEIEILYSWLLDFRNQEYAAMHKIFRLPIDNSPNGTELWDRYFHLKKWHFPEMQMLRGAARKCRDRWKQCPKFKTKGEDLPDEPENPEEKGIENVYNEDTERVGV